MKKPRFNRGCGGTFELVYGSDWLRFCTSAAQENY